jgi:hypothetical protein
MEATEIAKEMKVARLMVVNNLALGPWQTNIYLSTANYEASYLAKGIREITDFLLLLHTVINFILYSIFNKQFSKHTKKLFQYCIHKKRRYSYTNEIIPCFGSIHQPQT